MPQSSVATAIVTKSLRNITDTPVEIGTRIVVRVRPNTVTPLVMKNQAEGRPDCSFSVNTNGSLAVPQLSYRRLNQLSRHS